MEQISAKQFVRKLKSLLSYPDRRFTILLGSGCSVSSGIGDASTLVGRWLPKLKGIIEGSEDNYEQWAKEKYPEYEDNNKAIIYSEVMEELFTTPSERQEEIERICGKNTPGFGYAVLAQLMNYKKDGSCCNVVLTTNFDDMVADALYVYTNEKPLVMVHESLVSFVKISRTRPIVIKLHGDARIFPKNTDDETDKLEDKVKSTIQSLLKETGLIFIGYGGNDSSIWDIFEDLPETAPPWGIYWIGKQIPQNRLGELLSARSTFHVNHFDFDELMLLIRSEFKFNHPERTRFDKIYDDYFNKFTKLNSKIKDKLASPEKAALSEAAKDAVSELDEMYKFIFEAIQYEKDNPDKADKIYLEGLKKFPDNPELLTSYANFLYRIRKEHDKAEEYYKRSLKIDPKNAYTLGSYATFLKNIRKDYDKAEEYYKRSLEIEPENANTLGNYAIFLHGIHKEHDKAEEYYERSLEIDPDNANTLGNYALLLKTIRKDYDKAE
ncbi:MAG: tetratricopeptide repeat protein, partial [candidate division Zixibacteria bacterium]|nr:tetratricopeptide repeat protein [candidate division Zixibacteria bacterium]